MGHVRTMKAISTKTRKNKPVLGSTNRVNAPKNFAKRVLLKMHVLRLVGCVTRTTVQTTAIAVITKSLSLKIKVKKEIVSGYLRRRKQKINIVATVRSRLNVLKLVEIVLIKC